MPSRKTAHRFNSPTCPPKPKPRWIVYSTNREHCFAEEISKGYFGLNHQCGCNVCDRQMELPMPVFTRLPGEAA